MTFRATVQLLLYIIIIFNLNPGLQSVLKAPTHITRFKIDILDISYQVCYITALSALPAFSNLVIHNSQGICTKD